MRLRVLGTGMLALLGIAATTVTDRPQPGAVQAQPASRPAPEHVAQGPTWSDAWLLSHAQSYLDDPSARRAALERSLANPNNLYSAMRTSAYGGVDSGWDVLPVWNPRSRQLTEADVADLRAGQAISVGSGPEPLWQHVRPSTMEGWVNLGREVFFRYPLRAEEGAVHAFARGTATELGLLADDNGDVPGLVVYRDIEGGEQVGITCALCHTAIESGHVVAGRARRDLDYGAMRLAYERSNGPVDPHLAARMSSWGRGRADITEDDDQDPVAIPDLWRLRELRSLTQAATIVHESPLALAIRQETQMLHASGERVRPPRELAWALAMYLYALEPPDSATQPDATTQRGQALFASHCSGCHSDSSRSGKAVRAEDVGTDHALALGRARGTGRYRPAPLVGVQDASPYFHTGELATLADVLSPARLRPDFTGGTRGPGPVLGHAFGTDLPQADRAALVSWLRTL